MPYFYRWIKRYDGRCFAKLEYKNLLPKANDVTGVFFLDLLMNCALSAKYIHFGQPVATQLLTVQTALATQALKKENTQDTAAKTQECL